MGFYCPEFISGNLYMLLLERRRVQMQQFVFVEILLASTCCGLGAPVSPAVIHDDLGRRRVPMLIISLRILFPV